MKKIIILSSAAILLAACLFQFEFVEKPIALAVTNDVPAIKGVTQADDTFAERVSTEVLKAARMAFEKHWDTFNGDILNGSVDQQMTLIGHADYYAGALFEAGQIEQSRALAMQIKDWNEKLVIMAKSLEDGEEKEYLLHQISGTYSLFALFGMYDEAVKMAKVTIFEGQYNAAEYLTNLARTVTRKEGFKRAIPILDEALVAANKLPDEFRREHGIVDVAKVYAEVGRDAKARELITPLSHERQASGLLALYTIAKKKNRPESELVALLKDAETAAEQADRLNKPDVTKWERESLFNVALVLAQSSKIDEATAIFEKTNSASIPYLQDSFQRSIASYWYEQDNFAEMEACVDKMNLPTSKANQLSVILRQAKQTESRETIKRLIEKAEPFVNEMEPLAHRLSEQLRLAAYRMRIGETEEGRRRIDELIDTPNEESETLTRNWMISRASSSLAIAGMYDEAEKRIAMMGDDPTGGRAIWVADAYHMLNSIRRHEENPELRQKELDNQYLTEEHDH